MTATQLWLECAPVTVTIPSGHLWDVTVISSVTANPGNAYVEALLCPAYTGPQCVSGAADRMSFDPNHYGNWSSTSYSHTLVGKMTTSSATSSSRFVNECGVMGGMLMM